MKHTNIGLMALATVLIAGCGGGSSKTTEGDMPGKMEEEAKLSAVDLKGVTGFPLGEDGTLTVTLDPGDEEPGPQESKIKCEAGDDPCVFTVSRNQFGALTATYMGGKVTVTPKVEPKEESEESEDGTDSDTTQNQQNNNQQNQQQQQNQAEIDRLERENRELTRELDNANQRADSAQDGPRAERLVKVLAGVDGTDDHSQPVTVQHLRGTGQRRTVSIAELQPSSKAAPNIPGWRGIESSARSDVAYGPKGYLYTDLNSPDDSGARREFWKVHGVGNDDGMFELTGLDTALAEKLTVTVTGTVSGSLKIPNTNTKPVALDEKTPDSGTYEIVPASATGAASDYSRLRIDGVMFGGTRGTLICTSGCESTNGSDTQTSVYFEIDDGEVDFKSGTWQFKPGSLTALHDRPQDETYLYFGYWLDTPREPTGNPVFKVIRGGDLNADNGNELTTAPLMGTATYTGPAIGQYAINTSGPTPVKRTGMFTATATLNADFGDASAEGSIVSGSISGFDAGSTSTTGWGLTLGKSSEFSGNAVTGTFGSTSEIASLTVSGNWGAMIHGVNNSSVTTRPAGATCPRMDCAADVAGFSGWFRASHSPAVVGDGTADPIVSIAGAFAAK